MTRKTKDLIGVYTLYFFLLFIPPVCLYGWGVTAFFYDVEEVPGVIVTYVQFEPVQLTLFLICAYTLVFKYTPTIYTMLKASLTAIYEYDYNTKRITAWDANTGDEIEVEEYKEYDRVLLRRGEETQV